MLIGSHYSVRIPEAWLRLALADVLAISGLKLVQVPNVYLARRDRRVHRRRDSIAVRTSGAACAPQGKKLLVPAGET